MDTSSACGMMAVNRKACRDWCENLKRQTGRPRYIRILSQEILRIRLGGVDWMHLTQ